MSKDIDALFIFYLKLEETLPKSFYTFQRTFKELGIELIPVGIEQLQILAASTKQGHLIVMSSVVDSREYRLFNFKIRKLLKFILKSRRITFLQLSSYSKLNDFQQYTVSRNYFFLKYPLDSRLLSAEIVRYHKGKCASELTWPGGKRAGLGAVAI